jgi:hypothetical protein
MSWEDDELNEWQRRKDQKAQGEQLMLLRATIRREQCRARWIELQGQIRSVVITFNRKADRTVFTVADSPASELRIRREEDRAEVNIEFSEPLYRVSVAYPSCPGHDRTYVLQVMPVDGNETAVWINQRGNERQTDDAIAALTIRTLLRCGS